jgi:hypothetical protein
VHLTGSLMELFPLIIHPAQAQIYFRSAPIKFVAPVAQTLEASLKTATMRRRCIGLSPYGGIVRALVLSTRLLPHG